MPKGNKNPETKKNPELAKKYGALKAGKKHKDTIFREKVTPDFEKTAAELIERNMLEFLNSENTEERMFATKHFSEFVKPKKRELSGKVNLPINLVVSQDIASEEGLEEVKPVDENE